MKNMLLKAGVAAAAMLVAAPAAAAIVITAGATPGSTTDAFNGATIVDSSPLFPGSDARDALGGTFGTVEPGNAIFADDGGTLFFTFNTGAPVTIAGFNLFLADDSNTGSADRGLINISLSGSTDGLNFVLLDSAALQSNFQANYGSSNITVSSTFAPATFRFFRFDATEATGLGGRILELDAVTPVPEPATWAMMLLGFGAVGYSMRRRKIGYAGLRTQAV
jgi:hypothetical protein